MNLYIVQTYFGVSIKRTKIMARSHEEAYTQALLSWGLDERQVKEALIIPCSR